MKILEENSILKLVQKSESLILVFDKINKRIWGKIHATCQIMKPDEDGNPYTKCWELYVYSFSNYYETELNYTDNYSLNEIKNKLLNLSKEEFNALSSKQDEPLYYIEGINIEGIKIRFEMQRDKWSFCYNSEIKQLFSKEQIEKIIKMDEFNWSKDSLFDLRIVDSTGATFKSLNDRSYSDYLIKLVNVS